MMTDAKAITAALRLRSAREKAGYSSASAAAREHKWGEAAYRHHENGTRAFGIDQGLQYARAFKVSASWLLGLSVKSDSVRVPMAKFYISVYAENIGEGSDIYELIDSMYEEFGLSMYPELTITATDVEWMVQLNGHPPMHFMRSTEIGLDPALNNEGYVFAYRVSGRFPASRLEEGNLVLVDSFVGDIGPRPAMYLFRDESGAFIRTAQSQVSGGAYLIPDFVAKQRRALSVLNPWRLSAK